MIKYTFLLPAYKAKFFAEALESIKRQTYTDFRVLVSDDCSPDDLKSIYDEVVGADPRFSFRRNAENMGSKSLVSHWNLLVDMCETEFLIMASDDDVYEPNFLEEIEKLSKKYPEVNLFRGRVKCIDEKDSLLINDAMYPEFLDQALFFRTNFASNYLACEANFCYRTKALKMKGGYIDFPKAWFSDDATHIMIAENGCAVTPEIVFAYRHSVHTITNEWANSQDAVHKVEASLSFFCWMEEYYKTIRPNKETNIKQIGMQECLAKARRNAENHLQFCSFRDFVDLAKSCNLKFGSSKIYLYYNWLRCLIKK